MRINSPLIGLLFLFFIRRRRDAPFLLVKTWGNYGLNVSNRRYSILIGQGWTDYFYWSNCLTWGLVTMSSDIKVGSRGPAMGSAIEYSYLTSKVNMSSSYNEILNNDQRNWGPNWVFIVRSWWLYLKIPCSYTVLYTSIRILCLD
jgi:hypothetical protein